MEYDLTRQEMLELLSDIVQGDHIWRNDKDELLNFIDEIRDLFPND